MTIKILLLPLLPNLLFPSYFFYTYICTFPNHPLYKTWLNSYFFFFSFVSFYEHKCKTSLFLFCCLTESRVLLNLTFYHSGPSLGHSLLLSIASVIVFPSPPPLGLLHSSLISAHPHGNPVSHAISTRCRPANGWPASVTSSSGCCSAWKSRVGLQDSSTALTPGQLAVIISARAHQPSLAWKNALSSISQQSPIKTRALRETTWMTVDLQCSSLADMSCARP